MTNENIYLNEFKNAFEHFKDQWITDHPEDNDLNNLVRGIMDNEYKRIENIVHNQYIPDNVIIPNTPCSFNPIKHDKLFDKAVEVAFMNKIITPQILQRRLCIGYQRSCRIIDAMAQEGIITRQDERRHCKLLVTESQYYG